MAGKKLRTKAGTSKASAADKRTAFVEAFLSNGGNATQAAIAAGFSPHSAERQGARLTRDVRVKAELDKRRTEIVANLQLSTERTIRETARIAYVDPRKLMREDGSVKLPHELDEDTAAAISSFKVSDDGIEYKFWPKTTALDQAHKIQGHYEKDNRQKTDPLADLLKSIIGSSAALPVVKRNGG